MSTLAVTGITGHSGRFFLKELERNGFTGNVKCLIRERSNPTLLNSSSLHIERVVGDVNSKNDIFRVIQNADVVMLGINLKILIRD